VVTCDWCGEALSQENGLFVWQERAADPGDSEPFSWRHGASGPEHPAAGIVFLHTVNDTATHGCRSIADLPVDVAMTFQPGIRAALRLVERP